MAILKILQYPDYKLRKIAKPILKIDNVVTKIIDDMFETMIHEDGIGLAATQVNVPLQIIVINKIHILDNPIVLINPVIIKKSGVTSIKEGCLSIPNYRAQIQRSKCVTVTAFNYFGKKIKINAESILSICIQHEIDHLVGKLFIDYLSDLKKQRLIKKLKKKQKYESQYTKNPI